MERNAVVLESLHGTRKEGSTIGIVLQVLYSYEQWECHEEYVTGWPLERKDKKNQYISLL
jgi:arginine utilization protein RocB